MTVKKIFKLAGIGALIGIVVDVLISVLSAGKFFAGQTLLDLFGSEKAALLVEMLLVALFGAVCLGTTFLYDSERTSRLPLAVVSVIHCFICIVPFMGLAYILNWFDSVRDLLIMTCIQLAMYFIIWLIMYLLYKKQIKELNEIQRSLNATEKGGKAGK